MKAIIVRSSIFRSKFIVFSFIEMAGEGVHDNPNLKGFARYFNSETNVGRANVSLKLI